MRVGVCQCGYLSLRLHGASCHGFVQPSGVNVLAPDVTRFDLIRRNFAVVSLSNDQGYLNGRTGWCRCNCHRGGHIIDSGAEDIPTIRHVSLRISELASFQLKSLALFPRRQAAVDGSPSKEHAVANLYTVQHIGDKSINSNMQGNVGLLAPALPVTAWLPNANSQLQTVKA